MKSKKFSDLALIPELQTAIQKMGYEHPTPIQWQSIPIILEGHDLLGVAQTGTGKTAAFCLPILQKLALSRSVREPKKTRALILTPTRELAIQIHKNLIDYGFNLHLKSAVIFGGVNQSSQVKALQGGVDILVATPGRLFDLINQKYLQLSKTEILVLDEADRMLDMGFLPDIKRILPLLSHKVHHLFFSATMPPEIQKLASQILVNPKRVEVTPVATVAARLDQSVYFVEKANKMALLQHLLKNNLLYKVLVFVEMKHFAQKVVDRLQKDGVPSAAIHGNRTQNQRQRDLENFRTDKIRVLVATDLASRGIDVEGITHVINFELPRAPESYVHRIGRTARAGAKGTAISLCTAEEKAYLFSIEKTTRQTLEVIEDHPYHSQQIAKAAAMRPGKAKAAIESQRGRRPARKPQQRRFGGSGGSKSSSGSSSGYSPRRSGNR